jgi:hypothetical protein
MAERRLDVVQAIPLLLATEEVKELAGEILASRALPATADRDATHIALASVHEMDILLTWNCRHIANAAIQRRLRRVADATGFTLPVICTPEEFMENEND